ncbi:MAG TPA: Na+/H+ antiporter subunit G [Burkholderiales bacterium]
MLDLIADFLVALLILVGGAFTLLGSFSLVKLSGFFARLHGPTKAATLGVGCILLASSIHFTLGSDGTSLHEVLIVVFLFLTAPVSAHLLAKAALHREHERPPPAPGDSPEA